MKLIMIYDQIQAGLGTKDDVMLALGAIRQPVGPAVMMEPFLHEIDGQVIAILYCGTGFFKADPQTVLRKLSGMVKRLQPDVVLCGPALKTGDYADMCAQAAQHIAHETGIPTLAAMSSGNTQVIREYGKQIPIVRTPEKGEPGLKDSLKSMCLLAHALAGTGSVEELRRQCCYGEAEGQ